MSWQRTAEFALYVVLSASCCACETGDSRAEPASVTRGSAFEPAPLAGAIVVNDANLPVAHWGNDSYELARGATPVIANDTLTLAVSYSGGCKRHDFTLVADSRLQKSDPVRLVMHLAHDANGDTCEAYPTESYRFDLAPVRALWARERGSGKAVVRLLLRAPDSSRSVPDLIYTFQASP